MFTLSYWVRIQCSIEHLIARSIDIGFDRYFSRKHGSAFCLSCELLPDAFQDQPGQTSCLECPRLFNFTRRITDSEHRIPGQCCSKVQVGGAEAIHPLFMGE